DMTNSLNHSMMNFITKITVYKTKKCSLHFFDICFDIIAKAKKIMYNLIVLMQNFTFASVAQLERVGATASGR
ncbi:MAG: hypothetical protein J6T39_00140, partial [Clostridia bacterium]|nr:hypothetical protein [Clostridia bacterium]